MPCPHHATALHRDSACGPLGPVILSCSLDRMNRVWGRPVLFLFCVTLCPLGSEPAVLGHSLRKSLVSTAPSPAQGQYLPQGDRNSGHLLHSSSPPLRGKTTTTKTLHPLPSTRNKPLYISSCKLALRYGGHPNSPIPWLHLSSSSTFTTFISISLQSCELASIIPFHRWLKSMIVRDSHY